MRALAFLAAFGRGESASAAVTHWTPIAESGDQVVSSVRMPLRAVRDACLPPASLACHVGEIVGLCPEEQMIRPHARRVVAMVEHAEPIRDQAVGKFPRHPMSEDHPVRSLTESETSIAIPIAGAVPFPASDRLHSGNVPPEANLQRQQRNPRSVVIPDRQRIAMFLPAAVVHIAQFACDGGARAVFNEAWWADWVDAWHPTSLPEMITP